MSSPGTVDLHLFAVRLLHSIGAPVTKANLRFINAWANREGTAARNNPLATTQPASGATSFNSVGVRNYPSITVGATATAQTLENGNYSDVLTALRSGHPSLSQTFAGLHTWSGGGYSSLSGVSTKGGDGGGSVTASVFPTSLSDVPSFLSQHLLIVLLLLLLLLIVRK